MQDYFLTRQTNFLESVHWTHLTGLKNEMPRTVLSSITPILTRHTRTFAAEMYCKPNNDRWISPEFQKQPELMQCNTEEMRR